MPNDSNTYAERRRKNDQYIPEQHNILAALFPDRQCSSGTQAEDYAGIDAWAGADIAIALRVRSAKYAGYNDIAIRDIEWGKLLNGRTKYMLYCFAEDDADRISGWQLIDLDSIRKKAVEGDWAYDVPIRTAGNGDRFRLVNLDELHNPVVASGDRDTERTTQTTDDGEWITTTRTITTTQTVRRRKTEDALMPLVPLSR